MATWFLTSVKEPVARLLRLSVSYIIGHKEILQITKHKETSVSVKENGVNTKGSKSSSTAHALLR